MKKSVNKKKIIKKVSKNIPIGVKILAILGYIFSIISLVIGILSWIVSIGLIMNPAPVILPPDFPQEFVDLFSNNLVPLLVTMGFVFVVLGLIGIFVSRGLWKGRNWARVLVVIFAVFGIISNIIELVTGNLSAIVSLAINLVVVWYLLVNKQAQKYFAR